MAQRTASNAAGIQEVKIPRCLPASQEWSLRQCYGRDLARGTPVNMGEPSGSSPRIDRRAGHPGSPCATFTSAGAAQIADQSSSKSNFDGVVRSATAISPA